MQTEPEIRRAFIDRFVLDQALAVEVRVETRDGQRSLIAVVDDETAGRKLPARFGPLPVVVEFDAPVYAALA